MQITTAFHRFRGAADLRCPVRGVGGWARPWSSTVGVPHGRSLLCSALQSPAPTRPESGAGWTFTGVSAAVGHRADLLWARVHRQVVTQSGHLFRDAIAGTCRDAEVALRSGPRPRPVRTASGKFGCGFGRTHAEAADLKTVVPLAYWTACWLSKGGSTSGAV
jgi:hypothetical protein